MYSAVTNGLGGGAINDGTFQGTINPQALNSAGALANAPTNITPDTSPRGVKRSHSPDTYGNIQTGDLGGDGDSKPRKRGRPTKLRGPGVPESPQAVPMHASQMAPPHTPQSQTSTLPGQLTNITPTQVSPPKTTPTKTVVKALPTVRDHTTDQLGPEGDEYIPREYDDAGEKKVTPTGHLNDGREYRCRTFFVPNRGDKLFMLATECARVLGYRDSYLLFNKNRSLYKIIATQAEKEDLIHQEILPFSYRSRQIAIVTAKSMFRQFGSRVIVNGRRVRDDYWESKARKQGFTEEDLAGEKRPGAAKARDAAAAEANATATTALHLGHQGDVVYSNAPGHFNVQNQPQAVQAGMMPPHGGPTALPMITLAPDQPHMPMRDFSNIPRPRQEITGPAYQDRTQTSPHNELLTQSHHAAEYSKQINNQRERSGEYLRQRWKQPHEAPQPANIAPQPPGTTDSMPSAQAMQSPRTTQGNVQHTIMPSQNSQHMMGGNQYSQSAHQQTPIAQSPLRQMSQGSIRSDQLHGRSPSMSLGSAGLTNPYANFPSQSQMWNQPQQSPQHHGFPSYGSHGSQQSPHLQQSPHQAPQRQSISQMSMSYPGMQAMGQGYPNPGRGLYQTDQGSQQYMQSTSAPAPGSQGWAPQPPNSGGSWGWSGQPQ